MTPQEYKQLSKKKPKYRNKKTVVDDITFDSKKEAERYQHLLRLQANGLIKNLERQPVYKIIINDFLVCKIIPDFRYQILMAVDGMTFKDYVRVEDVKSLITKKNPVYRLKKKLLKAVHGVEVIEV